MSLLSEVCEASTWKNYLLKEAFDFVRMSVSWQRVSKLLVDYSVAQKTGNSLIVSSQYYSKFIMFFPI